MDSVVINIKTPKKVKEDAQRVSADLGLSLSAVINAFLKQLIRNRAVLFTLNEDTPSDYLLSSIKESEAERKIGDQYRFKDNREALDSLSKK